MVAALNQVSFVSHRNNNVVNFVSVDVPGVVCLLDDLRHIECDRASGASRCTWNTEACLETGTPEDDVQFVVVRQDDVPEFVVIEVRTLVLAQVPVGQVGVPGGDLEPISAVERSEVEFSRTVEGRVAEDDLGQVFVVT